MTETRKPVGRPPFAPTDAHRQIVQVLAANGIPHRVIARNLQVDEKTVRKHFREELADARIKVEAALGARIVQAGLAGNINAARYWLATHGGPQWRITETREITGKLSLHDQSTADLERDLENLRHRRAVFDRDGDMEADLPDEPEGVVH